MIYQRPLSMSFGPLNSGLVGEVTVKALAADGTTLIAETSAGISEVTGTGLYQTTLDIDFGWGFVIVIWQIASRDLAQSDTFRADDLTLVADPPPVGDATFDPTLPTARDRVRLRVGDTNGQPQWFLADATINALLEIYPFEEVCAQTAETIGAMCAQLAVMTDQPGLKIQYQQRSKAMYELSDRIRKLAQPAPDEPKNYGVVGTDMANPDLSDFLLMGPNGPRRF